MNHGRKISFPQAVDESGAPLPIDPREAPPAVPPPAPGMSALERYGPIAKWGLRALNPPVAIANGIGNAVTNAVSKDPEAVRLEKMADSLGLSPENKKRWLAANGVTDPGVQPVSTPEVRRPAVVGPEDREAPLTALGGAPPAAGTPGLAAGGRAGKLPSMLKEAETTTTHKGIPVSDAVRQQTEDAYYQQRAAAQQQADAHRAEVRAMGTFAADQAEATNAYLAHEDRIKRSQSEQLTAQRQQLEKDVQAVREGTIDPNRSWNNRSTGSKIAAIVGISLAEGLAAKHGGTNNVANRIMHEIDEDNAVQRGNLEQRGKAAAMQHSLIGVTSKQFDDEAQQRAAQRAMKIEAARQTLAATLSGIEDAKAQADGAAIDALLQEEYAKTIAHFDEISADKVIVQSQEVATFGGKGARGAGGAGGGAGDGLTKQEQTDTNDLSKELVKSGVPEARSALDRLLKVVPKEGDIPGVGGIHGVASMAGGSAEKADNIAYNFVGSKQGQEIRQAAAVLFNKQLKDESGAAVSDQELERHKQAFYGARDAASARRALEAYGARLQALEATIRSGHNENVNRVQQQRYNSRAGSSTVTPVGGK